MRCPRCRYENPVGQKFCGECGTRLVASCPGCGASNPAGQKFCGDCGTSLIGTEVAPTFGSPEIYTPKHLAEKILTSRSALEGERKHVTVLFADLKGSMQLLADRDPEDARRLLDPVLERMMEAVHHYEGTVNQVMGDGIMALFGAPIGHEDHAVRACYAAVRMQRRLNLYADEIQRAGGTPVQIRIGLNSGEVVVRAIGSDLHMDYTAVGQTTHLAARMEQMAKPGSALITGATLKLAEGFVQVRSLGAIPVKGLETPTTVYELNDIVPARSRFRASTGRGLTRFVGREGELQQLALALERAAIGHGQTVAVVGEAGVGKSRLVWEFARSHRTQGWLVLEGGSVSYGKATPYLPVVELLKAYCRIQERGGQREIRERVAGKLLMLDRALEPLLTPLLALLDVPVDDGEWNALDPAQRRQRTLEAVKRLLLRESQVQPLLVIFEDLHWTDSETQALLESLVESLPTARIMLLVDYRPEYQHGWGGKTYYLQLRIDPLPPESAGQLLGALLGQDHTLEPLKRVLVERTEGNPFFLEESVQSLVETEVLVGERGTYRMAKAPGQWHIPAIVQAILAARIDRLPSEEKRLLQAASVIGKDVPFPILRAVAEVSEASVRQGLARLQEAEFLYETSLFPDLEYTFKHALTHEVAYGSVLQERRRPLHARIVDAMEALYAERPSEQVERLAYHASRGELWDRAAGYLRQAGVKSATRSANREAVSYLEQALAALQRLPETRETLEQIIDLRCDLRNVHLSLGEHERILEHLHAAQSLAETLNDERRLGRILGYLSTHFFLAGEHDRALGSGERARAIARTLGDLPFQTEVNQRLAFVYHATGAYPRAIELMRWNIDALPGDLALQATTGPNLTAVLSRYFLVRCLCEQGEFAEALGHSKEGIELGESVTRRDSLAIATIGMGVTYSYKGDLNRAIPHLERALGICRTASLLQFIPWAASPLGLTYALSSQRADALSLLEEAVTYRNCGYESFATAALAEGYLLAGRTPDALSLAERALALSRERGERGQEAWSLRLLGEIHAHTHSSDIEKARRAYEEARDLAGALGMRPLIAHCHFGLGRLYASTGRLELAREHLMAAMTMYREMDMGAWLERAQASLKESGPKPP